MPRMVMLRVAWPFVGLLHTLLSTSRFLVLAHSEASAIVRRIQHEGLVMREIIGCSMVILVLAGCKSNLIDPSPPTARKSPPRSADETERRILDTIRRNVGSVTRSMKPDELLKTLKLEKFGPIFYYGEGNFNSCVDGYYYHFTGQEHDLRVCSGWDKIAGSGINSLQFAGHEFDIVR